MRRYATRPIDAAIWGFSKQSLDYRVYVTDAAGRVLFDSQSQAVGQDFSQWRDVARTLRGEYGARMTREVPQDDGSGVMHIAAPVVAQGRTVAAGSLDELARMTGETDFEETFVKLAYGAAGAAA